MLRITLVLSAVLALAIPAQSGTVVFDFDNNNSPILSPYGTLPIYQTVGGVTAKFDGNLSLQDARMVGMNYVTNTVTNVSSYFLFPSGGDSALSIEFSHLMTAISFNFATNDISQNGNSRLRMLLYNGSTPVGSPYTDAVGSGESTWSMGTLQFTSTAGSFNRVNIDILPGQGLGSTFTADNFVVTLDQSAAPRPNFPADPNVPEPAGMAVIGLAFIAFVGLRIRARH